MVFIDSFFPEKAVIAIIKAQRNLCRKDLVNNSKNKSDDEFGERAKRSK